MCVVVVGEALRGVAPVLGEQLGDGRTGLYPECHQNGSGRRGQGLARTNVRSRGRSLT